MKKKRSEEQLLKLVTLGMSQAKAITKQKEELETQTEKLMVLLCTLKDARHSEQLEIVSGIVLANKNKIERLYWRVVFSVADFAASNEPSVDTLKRRLYE